MSQDLKTSLLDGVKGVDTKNSILGEMSSWVGHIGWTHWETSFLLHLFSVPTQKRVHGCVLLGGKLVLRVPP